MSDQKKTIYKIKYEVEIEVTRELRKKRDGRTDFYYEVEPVVKPGKSFRDFDDTNDVGTVGRCDYLEENFPDLISDSFKILFGLEGRLLDMPNNELKSITRNETLLATKGLFDTRQRQRLEASAGRLKGKLKVGYEREKKAFISECVEIIKNIQANGEKLNRTTLGRNKFTSASSEHPSRRLKKKLDFFDISYEDLVLKATQ